MATIDDSWFEKADLLVGEPLDLERHETAFKDSIDNRTRQIASQVMTYALKRPGVPQAVAEFQSGHPVDLRYVELSAIHKFLKERDLFDEYLAVAHDDDSMGNGVMSFTNKTLDEQVNWRFSLTDENYPSGLIAYRFLHQVGDDNESWSYKMKISSSIH